MKKIIAEIPVDPMGMGYIVGHNGQPEIKYLYER